MVTVRSQYRVVLMEPALVGREFDEHRPDVSESAIICPEHQAGQRTAVIGIEL